LAKSQKNPTTKKEFGTPKEWRVVRLRPKFTMGIKTLLGLENFPLKDYELIQKLREARSKNVDTIEISTSKGKVVKINVSKMCPQGVMQGNYCMYKKGGHW